MRLRHIQPVRAYSGQTPSNVILVASSGPVVEISSDPKSTELTGYRNPRIDAIGVHFCNGCVDNPEKNVITASVYRAL